MSNDSEPEKICVKFSDGIPEIYYLAGCKNNVPEESDFPGGKGMRPKSKGIDNLLKEIGFHKRRFVFCELAEEGHFYNLKAYVNDD